jgi:protein SHQ1
VQIFIRLPYVKVSSCEFHIEAGQFKFYLKPYLLSLSFEQLLKEAEEPVKAVYYHDKYVLEVHVEKKQCGEEFKNLELIAGLLNRKKEKKKQSGRTLVQVVGDGGNYGVVLEEGDKGVVNAEYQYGFGLNYHNVFANL